MNMITPQLKHFIKIADGLDVAPVMAQLDAHPELWDAHSLRRTAPGTPHGGMSDIWVRYNDIEQAHGDFSHFNDRHVPVWYPAWETIPALRSLVMGIAAQVEAEMIGGVLITRIRPETGIDRHTDKGWHVEYYDKFYLSLRSAPGAKFLCEHEGKTECLEPRAGEVWLFDNRIPHWVENSSMEDRITLIICLRTEMFGRHKESR